MFQVCRLYISTKTFAGSECPTGWWFLGENCYFFDKRNKNFHEAERLCQNMNSKLFEPRDLQTNNLVFKTAETVIKNWKDPWIFFWIGIHDLKSEDNFNYASDPNNFKIQWSNFGAGEPSNGVHAG